MATRTLIEEIRGYETEEVTPLIASKTPISDEKRMQMGRRLNEFLAQATNGEEQIEVDRVRGLLTQIPHEKEGGGSGPAYGY